MADEAEQIFTEVTSCMAADTCEFASIGSGCTDGLLPLCGFGHVTGADLSRLTELDSTYRSDDCIGEDPVACADCAAPVSADCVEGACVVSY
jgi:hypothetical protein